MICYIAFMTIDEIVDQKLDVSPAGDMKSHYVSDVLTRIQKSVQIISMAETSAKKGFFPSVTIEHKNHSKLIVFWGFGKRNGIFRFLHRKLRCLQLIRYLFSLTPKDIVVYYHSLGLDQTVRLMKRVIGFQLIEEVEEIYSDVTGKKSARQREIEHMQCADAYIFPTELLNQTINQESKPYLIIHGTYRAEESRECVNNDNLIHVLYAGTLDPRKGGAAAAAAAAFLPVGYCVHILGFGTKQEIESIKEIVQKNNSKNHAKVTYDGVLTGEDYTRFVQSCDIGLSTQNPDAEFNATSFPSKILSYLANGLHVVSIRIPAIEKSKVGDLLFYYEEQTPQDIASAILQVDVNKPYSSRERLKMLDVECQHDFEKLIKNLQKGNKKKRSPKFNS